MYWTYAVSLMLIYQNFLRARCEVRWPDGDYALPMSIYGCPEPGSSDWKYGYMNISFSQQVDLYERKLGLVGWNQSFLMLLGPYGPYSYQLNFCTKSSSGGNSSDSDAARWPAGRYSIYRTNNRCPSGFSTKNLSLDLPEMDHINKDGHLPEIEIRTFEDSTTVVLMLCQKEENSTTETTQTEMPSPYIVFTDQDEEILYNTNGADSYYEELYFQGSDGMGRDKIYNWLSYTIVMPKKPEKEDRDCFDDPFLYSGNVFTTVTGFLCEPWTNYIGKRAWITDENFPEGSVSKAENFCRSPDNDGYPPWCYTTEPDKLWEYCGVPECSGQCLDYRSDCATLDPQANFCSSESDRCKKTCNACGKQVVNMECYKDPFHFAGPVSTTITGYDCQPWTNFVGQRSYIMDYNFPEETIVDAWQFCRSPDRGGFAPWCFSTNPEHLWEYCGIAKCEANCVDDSDGCSIMENAHEQFCVEYGDKCADTCGQCDTTEGIFASLLPPPDEYFNISCIRSCIRDEGSLYCLWLLYDLGQSVAVSSLQITTKVNLNDITTAVPEILLSENKWSFLSNGAMHCQPSIDLLDRIIDITCLNSPASSGRYLILMFQQTGVSHFLQKILNGQWLITLRSQEEPNRCSQALGMGTLVIEDFQISASSEQYKYPVTRARPNDFGWCLTPEDPSPYIQVSLLRPMVVEGIQIFNWEESGRLTNTSWYSPFIKGMGVYHFVVKYRSTESEFYDFLNKQVFYVDKHMAFEGGQIFLFASAVTTDLIRIYPFSAIDKNGMLCLRFELIGCQILDSSDAHCHTKADNLWYKSKRLFIPPYRRHTQALSSIDSSEICQLKCEEKLDTCIAAIFTRSSQICRIYEKPDTYSYEENLLDNKKDEGFIKICKTHSSKHLQKSSLYLSNDRGWSQISTTVTRPGYIISQGYPYHYTPGSMWLWDIDFGNAYVGLLLSNISFTVYKETNLADEFHGAKFLDKTDRLYILKSTFDLNNIFADNYNLDFVGDVIGILDSRNNDKRAQYHTNERKLRLLLRTIGHDTPVLASGNGFRAFVFASDVVTCFAWEICSWQTSVLGSGTVLGSTDDILFERWDVVGNGLEHITVDFVLFYVDCDGSSEFKMDYEGNSIRRYCNMDMPRRVVTVYSYLLIEYYLRRYSGVLLEGFKAKYFLSSNDSRMELADYSLQDDAVLFRGHEVDMEIYKGRSLYKVIKVCSEHFNKCYVLTRLSGHEMELDWNKLQDNMCSLNNQSSLTIHSKAEQQFIGHFVQKHIQDRRQMVPTFLYLGIHRRLLSSKRYKYRWRDGSPVTFSAWAQGEPSPDRNKNCARMDISSLTDDFTWDLIPCDQAGVAQFGGCQYTINKRNITMQHRYSDKLHRTYTNTNIEMNTDHPNIEKSTYFSCDNGIISFFGVCDGKADCIDGKDESDCELETDSCSSTEYQCSDGRCISVSLLCDHHPDCISGEDENCYFPSCGTTQFRCNNSQCIESQLRCDAKEDCMDASDEENCVITDCNNGTSFLCRDSKCIPNTLVCDGVSDCDAGDDEEDCQMPNTCRGWWNAGYTLSRQFKVHGVDMECDFDQVYTNKMILTKYYGTEIRRNVMTHMSHKYKDINVIAKLHDESQCYQSMDQFCQPWFKLLYDADTNQTQEERYLCQCVRYIHWFNQSDTTIENCNGETITDQDSVFHLTFSYTTPAYLLGDAKSETFNVEELMMQTNPIVCISDVTLVGHDISCGHVTSTPAETRCLYNLDEFKNIIGCRNLNHLQNCVSFDCPAGYVKCHQSFCLASRFICDGVKQCQYGEDEQNCESRTCPSQYRCLQSNICLSDNYLCDGYRDCPLGDDERLCNFRCPDACQCYGLSVDCTHAIITNSSAISFTPLTRLIDASHNAGLIPRLYQSRHQFVYLARLNMSFCSLDFIESDFFRYMQNLLNMDISYNNLLKIQSHLFVGLNRLETLNLNGNFQLLTIESYAFSGLHAINDFVMSRVHVGIIKGLSFQGLQLNVINLSDNMINIAEDGLFEELRVDTVYLNRTKIKTFQKQMFKGIENASTIVSDAYKFCCIRPASVPEQNCYPQQDEFSSCADLMRNDVLRPLIWIIGFFALIGNVLSLVYRFIYDRSRLKLGYGIFVTNLAFADFLMGVYMITIASADVFYRGKYIFFDEIWRHSFWCKMAGMLSTVASEGSVLFLCAITLDRLFVIKYPFGQVRFTPKLAGITCCAIWVIALIVAILPLVVAPYFHDAFYSKSGVCLALPLTRDRPPGWLYSISIFIVFNSATFLLIAIGQWSIYRQIDASRIFKSAGKSNSLRRFVFGNSKTSRASSTGQRTGRSNDLRVSRNLLLVVTTDFMCWCPIGILGVLALTGHVIPGDVYAWIAVVVLPINSALNPFLYTFSAIFGKKKFVPDTREQTRKETVFCDAHQQQLSLWKSKWFFKASQQNDRLLQLHFVAMEEGINIKECVQIARGIARRLCFLHKRNLVQRDLDLKDIYIQRGVSRCVKVYLDLRPMLVQKQTEKSTNIERLGVMMNSLMLEALKKERNQTNL